MKHCVNTSSPEFIAISEAFKNINPLILAAKVSLWQEANGLDSFPTAQQLDIKQAIQEDYALPFEGLTSESERLDFNLFRQKYHTPEDIALAKEKISTRVREIVGPAHSYSIESKDGLPYKVTISPTLRVNRSNVGKVTENLALRLQKIAHPSFIKGLTITGESNPGLGKNQITLTFNSDLRQAMAEGLENQSLEEFQSYMYDRFYESQNLEPRFIAPIIKTLEAIKEELAFIKEQPSHEFQGFYAAESGDVFYNQAQWKEYLEQMKEDSTIEEDYALTVNNPNTSIYIDPTYEYYTVKRTKQVKQIQIQIDKLKSKERIEGTSPTLSSRIAYLKRVKTNLENDLEDLKNSIDLYETTKTLLYRDLNLIRELIANPSIENFFLAEDISDFISLNLAINNPNSQLIKLEKDKKLDPKLKALIKDVSFENTLLIGEIDAARNEHFLNILTKYENNIKKLYPGKSLTEIRDLLLEKLEDISTLDSMFMSQGKNFVKEADVVAELIRLEYDIQVEQEKPAAQRIILKINTLVPKVEKELAKLGFVTSIGKGIEGVTKFSFYNYQSMFYRKDSKGNPMPTLVSKFSQKWDNFIRNFTWETNDAIFQARYKKDWLKLEELLKEKYYKLSANVDFVDFRKLEDVAALSTDPRLTAMFTSNSSENSAYKQKLIDTVGEQEYQNIVKQQVSLLQSFLNKEAELVSLALRSEGVTNYTALSDKAKANLAISLKRYSPLSFLESEDAGRRGMIQFTVGTQTNEKYSYLDYNHYYPKKDNFKGESTEYYDKDYEAIEKNPVLSEFWLALEEAVYMINDNLVDSKLKLDSKSILHMTKGLLEQAVDKGLYETAKALPSKDTVVNTVQYVKDALSTKKKMKGKEQVVQLPHTIVSFNDTVNSEFDMVRMDLSNIFGATLTNNTLINYARLNANARQQMLEALGLNNEQDFFNQVTLDKAGNFRIKDLRIFTSIAIMEQQTTDLPMLLKALLEQSVLHKARTAAKDNIDILKRIADKKILAREGKSDQAEDSQNRESGKPRTNANKRSEYFYDNVVLNESEVNQKMNLSEKFKDETKYVKGELQDPDTMFKYLLNFHYKNFSPQEKIHYRIMKKRWDFINTALTGTISDKHRAALVKEKESIEQRVDLMGKDYMGSTIISNILNKGLAIGIGLGYSSLGMMYNYLNARSNLFHRDGEFWSEGNAYAAFAFVDMHATRRINPEYNKQWKTMEAFVHQLDLVQDGTNELQKAKKTGITSSPKIYNLKRWAQNPLYGTELVEWYNQIPVMLCKAKDVKITNPTTNETVDLFDGMGFPAHEINPVTGTLQLKAEFRSPQNIEDFENFDSLKMALWKTEINTAIRSLNGDYSVSGVIRAKGNIGGQTLMLFKTWAGEYYHSRWALDQKSVALGKAKDGFISGSLMDKKTRGMASGMLLGNLATGVLMTPAISYGMGVVAATTGIGIAATGVIAGALYFKDRKALATRMAQQSAPSTLAWQQTLSYMIKATTIGTIEIPVNKAWAIFRLIAGTATGHTPKAQTLINIDSTFNGQLDERAAANLRNITRMFQKSNTSTLLAILIQLFLGDDEDEETELKGKDGGMAKLKQAKERKEKEFLFKALKNINQREYDEMNLGHNIGSTINMFVGDDATTLGPLEGIAKVAGQYAFGDSEETYNMAGSMYTGDTKNSVFMRKALIPQMWRNFGKEEWMLGLEIVGDREYQQNDMIDTMFESDYKKDRKEKEKERKKIKSTIENDLANKAFGKTFKSLTEEEKVAVDIAVKAKLSVTPEYQYPFRGLYDENQNKREGVELNKAKAKDRTDVIQQE